MTRCTLHASARLDTAKLIDGKKLSAEISEEVKQEVDDWMLKGNRRPHLSVVLVGDNPASKSYIKSKTNGCDKVGIDSKTHVLSDAITQDELLAFVDNLNKDDGVDGILVQLPLPKHMDERTVCNAVVPSKDVDGFHALNVGRFCLNDNAFLPATAAGVMEMIYRYKIPTFGKHAVILGRSKNVGMPIMMMLHSDGSGDATATICHRYTPPEQLLINTKMADILVVAVGIPGLIKADMVKPGAAIIDVGINRITGPDGKQRLVGDVDFEGVSKVASYITPVPGGVGPMTVAMLLKNTIAAAKKIYKY
ncbi:uncharacterized protein TRIADDRAFT_50697 [Trichoplax adhaerens]|uniref:methenyltetrahydrofolate cyclohydrolase n=1 Tax=Trichoplax adhaerens TaxID=10228 RepID=B3S4R1_TRIAD|nr:hypothetical protein TRIADDRAFT_50697 [Trichoplax adhaerens]EDV22257.1 hypothetical protein TRIADDRAFT_50697 [Trichoplax adhaerens]|eukprot:XP_002115412.1 hypothetical protein TRIADDRAFT_50697 [Trichoplax adhaerens]